MAGPADLYIVDLESGNLHSVRRALAAAAEAHGLALAMEAGRDAEALARARRIVLPGVGAFSALARFLQSGSALRAALEERRAAGAPILGICVGMQLMGERGTEFEPTEGLGWFQGEAVPLRQPEAGGRARVPRIGWCRVRPADGADGGADGSAALLPREAWFYFAHSYALNTKRPAAVSEDGLALGAPPVAAAVAEGPLWGVQFHPEKSGPAGLALLGRFLALPPAPSLAPLAP